jgi:hypothetical protein
MPQKQVDGNDHGMTIHHHNGKLETAYNTPPDELPPPEPPPQTQKFHFQESTAHVCDNQTQTDHANIQKHHYYPGYSYGEKIIILVPCDRITIAKVNIQTTTGTTIHITIHNNKSPTNRYQTNFRTFGPATLGSEFVNPQPSAPHDNNFANQYDNPSDAKQEISFTSIFRFGSHIQHYRPSLDMRPNGEC